MAANSEVSITKCGYMIPTDPDVELFREVWKSEGVHRAGSDWLEDVSVGTVATYDGDAVEQSV